MSHEHALVRQRQPTRARRGWLIQGRREGRGDGLRRGKFAFHPSADRYAAYKAKRRPSSGNPTCLPQSAAGSLEQNLHRSHLRRRADNRAMFIASRASVKADLGMSTPHGPRIQPGDRPGTIRECRLGLWRLVGTEKRMADGSCRPSRKFGPNAVGFALDCHPNRMCAVLVDPRRARWKSRDDPTADALGAPFDHFQCLVRNLRG
jgi:hypothetical protein